MKLCVVLMSALLTSCTVNAECGGSDRNNHSYYSEGSGGTALFSFRNTYDAEKKCCNFNDTAGLNVTIRSIIINGFGGSIIKCVRGGVGTDFILYTIEGPSGKGKTIDIYGDWKGKPKSVGEWAGSCGIVQLCW